MGITSATVLTSRYKRYIELHYCTIHHDLLTSAQFYILQVITWSRCWRGGSLFSNGKNMECQDADSDQLLVMTVVESSLWFTLKRSCLVLTASQSQWVIICYGHICSCLSPNSILQNLKLAYCGVQVPHLIGTYVTPKNVG